MSKQSFENEELFLKNLARAYTEYDAKYILPFLADDFGYSSFWVTAPDLIKDEYTKYIVGKLATMKKLNTVNKFFMMYEQGTGKPFLLIGSRTPDGGLGCFDVKSNPDGKITSLAIMPSSLYHLGYKNKEEFEKFLGSI